MGRQNCCSERDWVSKCIPDDGTITNLGATIKATSVSQLESLARQIDSLETMGVSNLDLEGLEIPVNVAKIFAEASGSTNINFLNQPKLLITSEDNLGEVLGFLSEIISLGVRENYLSKRSRGKCGERI